jgi:hypothetical protein
VDPLTLVIIKVAVALVVLFGGTGLGYLFLSSRLKAKDVENAAESMGEHLLEKDLDRQQLSLPAPELEALTHVPATPPGDRS